MLLYILYHGFSVCSACAVYAAVYKYMHVLAFLCVYIHKHIVPFPIRREPPSMAKTGASLEKIVKHLKTNNIQKRTLEFILGAARQ